MTALCAMGALAHDFFSKYTYDPGTAFLRHDARQRAELERLPKCDCCGEPIQDEYLWDMGDAVYCEECAKDRFRVTNKAI